MKPSNGLHGVLARETAPRASEPSESSRGWQENGAGTGAATSTRKLSSKLRLSLASLIVHQVGGIKIDFFLVLPGITCANLTVKVDQEVSGPVYNLKTALARPLYPQISAVSLVKKKELEQMIISIFKGGVQR